MGEQEAWQLAGSAPELYQRYLLPAMTAMWAATHALAEALDRHVHPDASAAKRTEHSLADIEGLRALAGRADRVGAIVQDVAAALTACVRDEGLTFPQEVHVLVATS